MSATTLDSLADYAYWHAGPGEIVSHAFTNTNIGSLSYCGHREHAGVDRKTDAYCAECVIALYEVFGDED